MQTKTLSVNISESIGKVSAVLTTPENATAALVLAHGAGAGMLHPFMTQLATLLASESVATIRYNFPFVEKKSKRPDVPAVAEKTVGVLLDFAIETFPEIPVFLAGKSFGGRMSSQYISKNPQTGLKGIIFYGFPLHPPGKPGIERAEHLKKVNVPMLFLQGTKDTLATIDLIQPVCAELPTARLVTFDGADHSFKAKGKILLSELASATVEWIAEKGS